jgi:hypothetical protein
MADSNNQVTEPNSGSDESKEIAAPKEYTKSTHFLFDHKLFAIPDCCFLKDPNSGEPGLSLPLGEIRAFLPLGPLMKMFKDFSEDDTRLLNVAIRGLNHVREIRPGDSIPAEILDGSASWSVGPEQLDRARGRILVALVSVDGKPTDPTVGERGANALANDAAFEARRTKAMQIVHEKLGDMLGAAKRVQDVLDKVGRELSYVEGLRERYSLVNRISARILSAARLYKNTGGLSEEIYRIRILMRVPIEDYRSSFANVDAQLAEVLNVLRKPDEMIAFIRKNRDDLHQRLMIWDALIAEWKDEEAATRSKRLEILLRATYRFVARHFPADQDWTLTR